MKRRLRAFEVRAAKLQQQIPALDQEAALVDEEIARWRIGSKIWDEAEHERRGDADGSTSPSSSSASHDAPIDTQAGSRSVGGTESRYVPQRQASEAPDTLPGPYSKIVEFVWGEPVRVRDVSRALFGEGASRSRREGVRCQLKRLVQRGWLASADGREFTAAA
ncbi:hypothetical protein ABT026_11300 [Streptomyces sp. NPDC002734]|uniref:hypothetical protein n=1 Tax=Streptomyces sp. NPDC002734 TaxID=3154426 RepID=UPI00332C89AF